VTPRRELQLAAAVGLLGSVVVLVAVTRSWLVVEEGGGLTIGAIRRTVAGTDVVPGVRTLGLVGAAGVVAIAATRGWGRVVVGGLLLAAGVLVVTQVVPRLDEEKLFRDTSRAEHLCVANGSLCSHPPGARLDRLAARPVPIWLTLGGGLLVAGGGALTVVRGRGWAGLGASYEAPGAARPEPVTDKGVWDALDRGDDPTA
jgi:uncharacterized membrane protein (TIGR02234 family)